MKYIENMSHASPHLAAVAGEISVIPRYRHAAFGRAEKVLHFSVCVRALAAHVCIRACP